MGAEPLVRKIAWWLSTLLLIGFKVCFVKKGTTNGNVYQKRDWEKSIIKPSNRKGDCVMGYYGPLETWKVVYHLPPAQQGGGRMGVAFVEADCRQMAMFTFMEQYKGQYSTVQSCQKLIR